MTNNKKMFGLGIMIILSLIVFSFSVVGFSTVFVSPDGLAGANSTLSYFYNVTVISDEFVSANNCTVTFSSATTGDSETFNLFNVSAAAVAANNTFGGSLFGILQDYTDYALSGYCTEDVNGSTISITTLSSLTYDVSSPTVSNIFNFGQAMTNSTVLGGNNLQLSFTAINATSSCVCYLTAGGTAEQTVTCSLASQSTNPTTGTCNGGQGAEGTIVYRIELSDGTQTSSFANQFLYYGENDIGGQETIGGQYFQTARDFLHTKKGKTFLLFAVLIVASIAVIIIAMSQGGGKRRRRRR